MSTRSTRTPRRTWPRCGRYSRPSRLRKPDFDRDQSQTLRLRARELSESIVWWYRDRYRLTVTDDRFLDASYDDMLVDFYADYNAKLRASGKSELYEDDAWDLDAILKSLEEQEDATQPPADEWETVEDWDATKLPPDVT